VAALATVFLAAAEGQADQLSLKISIIQLHTKVQAGVAQAEQQLGAVRQLQVTAASDDIIHNLPV
jgi:hypothetical protein